MMPRKSPSYRPRFLKKIRDDPDNCREVYKDIGTGEVFVTVDGELHAVTDEGEPLYPLNIDVRIVPPSCPHLFEKGIRGRLKSLKGVSHGPRESMETAVKRAKKQLEEKRLAEEYEEHEESHRETRELPQYQIRGKIYYRDEKLKEYRNVDDPFERITFDQFEQAGMEFETPSRR